MLKAFGVLPPRLKPTSSNRQWNGVLEVKFTSRKGCEVMRRQIKGLVATAAAVGVMAGSLVGGASVAQAAVGDATNYFLGSGGSSTDLEDIVTGPDGLLWAWDDNESDFIKVNSSGAVQGVISGRGCSSDAFKISFADSLWCFDDDAAVSRIYADGRRTLVATPGIFHNSVTSDRYRAAVGPDGQLWVIAHVRLATVVLASNLPTDPTVTKDAALVAVPLSADGAFGAPLTLNVRQGNWGRTSRNSETVALAAGPDNKIYFAWSPGYDIFTGLATNVYGSFTTDGVVSSDSEVGQPGSIGVAAGGALSNGGQVYLLGKTYRTERYVTDDGNGNQVPAVGTVSGQELYRSLPFPGTDGTLSVFTSGNSVSRQPLPIDTLLFGSGKSRFVADQLGYFWAPTNDEEAARFNAAGVASPRVTMPNRQDTEAVTIGLDGNLWVAAEEILVRVLTGSVPTNAAAPTLSQVDGITVGTPITGTSGEWNDPSGSYDYQWQVCTANDASTCTDIPGATVPEYTPSTTDDGKYVRMATYATSANGRSAPAYSGLVAVGVPAAPPAAPGAAVKATGSTAVIGNAQTMELDVPRKTKRGKKKFYEVFFTASDVPGTVTFTFKRKKRVKTVTVPIEDGIAEYRWKTPRKWPRGKTRVTATYVPSAGSPYAAAAVTDRVKVRGR